LRPVGRNKSGAEWNSSVRADVSSVTTPGAGAAAPGSACGHLPSARAGRAAQGRGGDVRSGRRRRTIVVSLRELRASRRSSRNLMIIFAELAL